MRTAVWFHAKREHDRCSICFEDVDGEGQRRSEGAALCPHRSGESLDRVSKEELWCCMRTPGVAEKYVRAGQDMFEDCNSGEVCCR